MAKDPVIDYINVSANEIRARAAARAARAAARAGAPGIKMPYFRPSSTR